MNAVDYLVELPGGRFHVQVDLDEEHAAFVTGDTPEEAWAHALWVLHWALVCGFAAALVRSR